MVGGGGGERKRVGCRTEGRGWWGGGGGGERLLNDIATFARRQHDLSSVQFSSIEDVVCALWKAHMRSVPPLSEI